MEKDLYKDLEQELNLSKEKIHKLESKLQKLKEIIIENDLEDEIEDIQTLSDSELICVKGISQILELVEKGVHQDSDIKNFDILYKNLRLIQGKTDSKDKKTKPTKEDDLAKLLKIAKG
jgi:vacuolar-type H+-ATPase subunit I/STV1